MYTIPQGANASYILIPSYRQSYASYRVIHTYAVICTFRGTSMDISYIQRHIPTTEAYNVIQIHDTYGAIPTYRVINQSRLYTYIQINYRYRVILITELSYVYTEPSYRQTHTM